MMAKRAKASNDAKKKRPAGKGRVLRAGRDDWRRKYYIPRDRILKAARDLCLHSTHEEIEEYAGRMFALQDLVDHERLDEVAVLERESDDAAYLEIVRAVRKETASGDPEYARSIAGEFLEQAFRVDSATVRVWLQFQNRMRQQRIDAGLGLIDPPDGHSTCPDCKGPAIETLPRLIVKILEVKTLKVRRLKLEH